MRVRGKSVITALVCVVIFIVASLWPTEGMSFEALLAASDRMITNLVAAIFNSPTLFILTCAAIFGLGVASVRLRLHASAKNEGSATGSPRLPGGG